jgi:DNA-binding GntR family transcriptional regulator
MAHELAEAGRIRLVQGLDGNLGSRTLHESVYKRLREFILDGDVSPGDRLDERHLSAALGVSRTPIRDAIGRLAAEGLIDYRPHQGNYIKVLSVKEFDELYVVRAELECLAVKLASDKSSPEFLKALEETVIESERALGKNDLAAFGQADRHMHRLVVETADNAALTASLERIETMIRLGRSLANRQPEVPDVTSRQRRALLRAFQESDVDAAVSAMRDHIETVRAALHEGLKEDRAHTD